MAGTTLIPTQQWKDRAYCRQYAETWEISTKEVHYGWLAPGESTLGLLRGIDLQSSTVLDIGCGMGENLVSLSRKGANCFGVDISPHMLRYARRKHADIALVQQDMRELTAFPGVLFDVILSVYSLEYLESLKEFRDVLATLFNRLRPGGIFVFCFSHPLQHLRHSMLRNESAYSSGYENSPFIYSFKDVVLCLNDTGFTIDRIVEQQTHNPSQLSYLDSIMFPYHFREGKNPCSELFDEESNAAPHTIIYKTRKPDSGSMMHRQMSLEIFFGGVRIWGEYRRVVDSICFNANERKFSILKLQQRDAVVGVCSVMRFDVSTDDTRGGPPTKIRISNAADLVPRNCLLGILSQRCRKNGLVCAYQRGWIDLLEHRKLVSSVFISRIDPVFGEFLNVFPREEIGVLVFVNGQEPGEGKVALHDFFPAVHDHVEVVYVACDRARSMAGDFLRSDSQLDLFGLPPSSFLDD